MESGRVEEVIRKKDGCNKKDVGIKTSRFPLPNYNCYENGLIWD
jgi:hypothetical protein